MSVNLKNLLEGGAIFDLDLNKVKEDSEDEDEESTKEIKEAMSNFVNFNCEGQFDELFDEDSYVQGQPFEILGSKMTSITDDGGVKKRSLREGYGDKPADLALVKVHYNAYIEYESTPYDSTYARKKAHKFVVNNGEVIPGLDLAVQSMKTSEKSQFIFTPDYGYGKLGCLGRIPPNSSLLFEIELIEIIDSGAALTFKDLPKEEQRKFEEVYKYCMALCARGKDVFKQGNVKGAIKEYNQAVARLESAQLENYEDQEKQNELLHKLYTNLIVCYTKVEEPRKSCNNFNKLKNLLKETNVEMPAKALYNNAKCLRMLGDFQLAKRRLKEALKLDPKSPDIANEFITLNNQITAYKQSEAELAKKFMGQN
ncbi:unnamed protein product [Brassicogethes aeneus]|uniref:PPIase FKBP-type domain-containing protein n=1 Tax=Brassicogethes aeneus TaxID=1431903 RepID=A0A9P0B045_BRAAE|nr:unnamed protein product [Brassicogethes aeneus]